MAFNDRLTWLFVYLAITCTFQAQNTNIKHINLKINRLNRITDVLQKDVDDIWTAMSASGTQALDFSNKKRKDDLETSAYDMIGKMNGTFINVQELKTEIEQLVLYSRNGLKNEKQFQREAIKDLKKSYRKFKTRLDTEMSDLQETNKNNQLRIETINRDLNERVGENDKESEAHGILIEAHGILIENLAKTLENLSAKQSRLETENQELKQTISELTKLQATAFHNTCDEGWSIFNGHCYLLASVEKTWHEALAICESKTSYLVEITTESELQFISEFINEIYTIWTGATNIQSGYEGTFVYQQSKRQVPQRFWNDGEPNNDGGKEHCVEMYTKQPKLKFNDVPCTFTWAVVCEK